VWLCFAGRNQANCIFIGVAVDNDKQNNVCTHANSDKALFFVVKVFNCNGEVIT
jgi:hypothetical protein